MSRLSFGTRRSTLTLGLLTLSLGGAAFATTFSALTLGQQARKAEVIVQASIGTPTTVNEGGQSYTVYPLKVSETLAGDASQLPKAGNSPALYVLSGVEQAPVFQAGQEAVLLLYRARLDSPLVGFNQGAFLIANNQVSVLPVSGGAGPAQGVPDVTPPPVPTNPVPAAQGDTTQGTATQGAAGAGTTPGATGQGPVAPPVGTPPIALPMTGTTDPSLSTQPVTGSPATPLPVTPPSGTVSPPGAVTTSTPGPGAALQPTPTQTAPAPPVGTPAIAPATTPPAGTAVPTPLPAAQPTVTPLPVTVLGSIRTPAELKAAIVAARSAK